MLKVAGRSVDSAVGASVMKRVAAVAVVREMAAVVRERKGRDKCPEAVVEVWVARAVVRAGREAVATVAAKVAAKVVVRVGAARAARAACRGRSAHTSSTRMVAGTALFHTLASVAIPSQ